MSSSRRYFSRVSHVACFIVAAVLFALAAGTLASTQTFQVLHNFTNGADGSGPLTGLTMSVTGDLYGTAHYRRGGYGSVYRLKREGQGWIFSTLYDFAGANSGAYPYARPLIASDGSLYGTAETGPDFGCLGSGCGVLYHLRPQPTFQRSATMPWLNTVVLNFGQYGNGAGGLDPQGDLTTDLLGNIYGTTTHGGPYCGPDNGCGVVYAISQIGGSFTENVLYAFHNNGDGDLPLGGVVFDSSGDLFGVTEYGATHGVVYELSPSLGGWVQRVLHSFQGTNHGADGDYPFGGLIIDSAGNLYGTTEGGGANGVGIVFQLMPVGNDFIFNKLYDFTSVPGNNGPYYGPKDKLTLDTAGNLYGTTYTLGVNHCGSVFKLSPSAEGWIYTSLHDFTCGNDGGGPVSSVLIDSAGNLYGTASDGGTGTDCQGNCGVVWEITP